jgi:hypothetical protein
MGQQVVSVSVGASAATNAGLSFVSTRLLMMRHVTL